MKAIFIYTAIDNGVLGWIIIAKGNVEKPLITFFGTFIYSSKRLTETKIINHIKGKGIRIETDTRINKQVIRDLKTLGDDREFETVLIDLGKLKEKLNPNWIEYLKDNGIEL